MHSETKKELVALVFMAGVVGYYLYDVATPATPYSELAKSEKVREEAVRYDEFKKELGKYRHPEDPEAPPPKGPPTLGMPSDVIPAVFELASWHHLTVAPEVRSASRRSAEVLSKPQLFEYAFFGNWRDVVDFMKALEENTALFLAQFRLEAYRPAAMGEKPSDEVSQLRLTFQLGGDFGKSVPWKDPGRKASTGGCRAFSVPRFVSPPGQPVAPDMELMAASNEVEIKYFRTTGGQRVGAETSALVNGKLQLDGGEYTVEKIGLTTAELVHESGKRYVVSIKTK